MKILKLSSYYQPEQISSSHLTKDLEDAYIKNGFEIVVHTPMPTRNISEQVRAEYKKKKYEEKYEGKIKIYRFPMFREGKNTWIRAFRYILCNMIQYWKGCHTDGIDIIIGSSTPPTQGLLCSLVKKRLKVPFIYNLQDIFPDSLVSTGLTHERSILWKIGRKIENKTYQNADAIVVISEDFKYNIMSKGVPEDKITIIRNWVDEKNVVSIPRDKNTLFDLYNLDRNKFYICYSGNVGYTQNMEILLEVAKSLKNYLDIVFVIIGDGAVRDQIASQIDNEEISNVVMLPFQPYERISEVFSLGNVGLIISKPGVGNNSVPSKTWSIMAAERPILASFDKGSELDSIITKLNCGECVQSDDAKSLRKKILEMYEDSEKLKQQGRNGRRYIMENLTREMGTNKWIELIKKVGDYYA